MTQSSSGGSSAGNPAALRFESLLEWVTSQTGLSFRGQRESATDILRRAIKRRGDANPDDFRRRLAADRAAFDDLIGELTIGETYFFRDRSQFELITNYFFQHLNKIRPPHHQIRIWSRRLRVGRRGLVPGGRFGRVSTLAPRQRVGNRYLSTVAQEGTTRSVPRVVAAGRCHEANAAVGH